MKMLSTVLLFLCFVSCGPQESRGTAYIMQRRLADSGKLVLSYRFQVKGRWIWDSTEISNRSLPNDSLPVVFSSENPAESRLELPR